MIVSSTEDPLALTWTTTVLYTLAMLLAATLPHDPDLHYDLSNIYAPATFALASSSLGRCGIATASALSYLTFSYTTRVVVLGHTSSSLEIGDLHILPGDMRASTAYARMKHTL
ncbi:hypothetical protein FIBSPDRAFT_952394 [Athelia psychrophila]|uniref:Uncharacterized protein n=1 Tax=Athelia psychrophila TaxID=1759441 RepID=A0A166LL48_9AGAM|nr:hypothetical protein FIBSPDRAFT_952394 [Fibularhizoctonia sp. CBS 109695]